MRRVEVLHADLAGLRVDLDVGDRRPRSVLEKPPSAKPRPLRIGRCRRSTPDTRAFQFARLADRVEHPRPALVRQLFWRRNATGSMLGDVRELVDHLLRGERRLRRRRRPEVGDASAAASPTGIDLPMHAVVRDRVLRPALFASVGAAERVRRDRRAELLGRRLDRVPALLPRHVVVARRSCRSRRRRPGCRPASPARRSPSRALVPAHQLHPHRLADDLRHDCCRLCRLVLQVACRSNRSPRGTGCAPAPAACPSSVAIVLRVAVGPCVADHHERRVGLDVGDRGRRAERGVRLVADRVALRDHVLAAPRDGRCAMLPVFRASARPGPARLRANASTCCRCPASSAAPTT